jgi:two-component system, cell cycle sensor histidine kinase and response regulator CckA
MAESEPTRSERLRFILGLAPGVVFLAALVGWLAYALYDQTRLWQRTDQANLREWLDESRVFRKSLPEMIRDCATEQRQARDKPSDDSAAPDLQARADEIHEQLMAMTDPTRIYKEQIPLFPEVYRIEVQFTDATIPPIVWESPVPRPRQDGQVHQLVHNVTDNGQTVGHILCDYRLHAYARTRREEEERARAEWTVGALVVVAGAVALIGIITFLVRERRRELGRLHIQREKEQTQKLLLEEQLRVRDADRVRQELDRKLLEQSLETAKHEGRASAAERSALELKSQLYASIGIMAGSYAHNIKNLLVRPNDLLTRCLEADGLSLNQESMLQEIRLTLGTVTERLQQILRTVRRDPSRTEMTRLDLNQLAHETCLTWKDLAREKWKLALSMEVSPDQLWVQGDLSHLQQAIENLIFNARDATFEMRSHLREQARANPNLDDAGRRKEVLAAAGWRGEIHLRTWAEDGRPVLEISDNGIGMTEEVRLQCTQTHFSTKRDNALYEGLSAGMGLGLSFVAVILEHHGATLEIESKPLQGATFRVRFPRAEEKAD